MRKFCALCLACGFLAAVHSAAIAADFPQPFNTGGGATEKPLDAAQAAAGMKLPPGFKATVFAAEPDLGNPLACTWDTRGRLWVAECFTYGDRTKKFDLALRDRVTILADRDGDGRAEEKKVFTAGVERLMSVEVGMGGVWLICLPQLLFIPDRNGDDVPDGPAEVVLDGFETSTENYHNCVNGLRWGPDGWLYGRAGASSPARIGRPGTPEKDRTPIAGGMWRYHPGTKVFESLCGGTTNPWGHDWDEHGEVFFVNTVTGHLFHMLPGAHYTRSATISPNRRMYAPLDSHADHYHWDTGKGLRDKEGKGIHDSLGGGHAHSGCTIYLGHQWPAEYRGQLFTLNLHGRRMNVEKLERHGSGYVGRHEPDMCQSADIWFRGIEVTYGPDGAVYLIDWSDIGECHEHDGVHRLSGRVFRVSYEGNGKQPSTPEKGTANKPIHLPAASVAELAALHTHPNEWYVRQARRELANRQAAGQNVQAALPPLRQTLTDATQPVPQKLRALWTLFALSGIERDDLLPLVDHADEHMRAWGLRLLTDRWPIDTVRGEPRATAASITPALVPRLAALAEKDPSGLVRLTIASLLQRLPVSERAKVAAGIVSHAGDAEDHNLPQLVWYGLAPLVDTHSKELVPLAVQGKFPLTRNWIARGLAEEIPDTDGAIDALLAAGAKASDEVKGDIVRGLTSGLAGRRKAVPPPSWAAFEASLASAAPDVRELARGISVVFGDGRALDEVRRVALDDKAKIDARRAALETLIEARPPDLRDVCEKLLKVRFLNTTALGGLTLFDDRALGDQLAKSYNAFHPSERAAVIEALVARKGFAMALVEEMATGKIPTSAVSAYQARQIRSLNDVALSKRLSEVWGELRDSPKEKQELIEQLKGKLTAAELAAANARAGRAVYQTACANCHRLYGVGGTIGPDLTGSGRQNLDYLLSNIIDPSAVVNKDFRMSVVQMDDGRVLNGIVVSQDKSRVVLQTIKEQLTLPRDEIDEIALTPLSPMPEGILQPLTPVQVRDLIAYLMTSAQVEMPLTETSPTGR